MLLQWAKCPDGEWCQLEKIERAELEAFGVFVVWRPGDAARASVVLFVGGGPLRRAIGECRRNPIADGSAELRVTWAAVDPEHVDGVAAYLYRQLRPLWGAVPGPVPVQPVNLPLTA